MKVIVSGGGTGGHIYPALAFAKFAESEFGAEILFIGNETRMEAKLVPANGYRFFGVKMQGLNRRNMFKNFAIPFKTYKSYRQIKKTMKEFKPDIVIGTGGYVTVPALLAAKKVAKQSYILEPDMKPGKANTFLAKHVTAVLTSFEEVVPYYQERAKKTIYLGNPVALGYKQLDAKRQFSKQQITLLGGSLGADYINQLAITMAADGRFSDKKLVVVTGERFYSDVHKKLEHYPNVEVKAYEDNIVDLYEQTTLLISRSGATTVAEVRNKALPTFFIPSPHVANNEQLDNVRPLLEKEACKVFEETKVDQKEIIEETLKYMDDYDQYEKLQMALSELSNAKAMHQKLIEIFNTKAK